MEFMSMGGDEILEGRPVASTVLIAAVAALAYGGIQFVADGTADLLETGLFVLVFTLVYVGGSRIVRARGTDEDADHTKDATDDSEQQDEPA